MKFTGHIRRGHNDDEWGAIIAPDRLKKPGFVPPIIHTGFDILRFECGAESLAHFFVNGHSPDSSRLSVRKQKTPSSASRKDGVNRGATLLSGGSRSTTHSLRAIGRIPG